MSPSICIIIVHQVHFHTFHDTEMIEQRIKADCLNTLKMIPWEISLGQASNLSFHNFGVQYVVKGRTILYSEGAWKYFGN